MKKYLFWVIMIAFHCSSFAQQNLFNVPSSEITAKNKVFFQQQFNISRSIQSNTNLCYGIGKNSEIGINVIGIQTTESYRGLKINDSKRDEPLTPLAVFTFQKVIPVTEQLRIGVGTQLGSNLIRTRNGKHELADFTYLNSQTVFFKEKIKLNAGLYYGDRAIVGEKSHVGLMFGTEIELNHKIHLVSDWISGKTPIGVGVVGLVYFIKPQLPLSFGWQLPNSKQRNSDAFVFELTFVPKN